MANLWSKITFWNQASVKICDKLITILIRNFSDDAAIHLLFAANRWEKAQTIRSKLEKYGAVRFADCFLFADFPYPSGETVIADRYAYSGAAFTAAKGKQR